MSSTSSKLGFFVKLAIATTLAIVIAQFVFRGRSLNPLRHVGVGDKLGEVSLERLTADPRPDASLASEPPAIGARDLKGRVVLMDFWGTWCPPCRKELPHLVDIKERLADRPDFLLVAVSCGDADNDLAPLRRETEDYLRGARLNLATYADRGSATRARLQKTAGMNGYPFTLVLDRAGVIRGVWSGYAAGSEREMEALIRELLDSAKVAGR